MPHSSVKARVIHDILMETRASHVRYRDGSDEVIPNDECVFASEAFECAMRLRLDKGRHVQPEEPTTESIQAALDGKGPRYAPHDGYFVRGKVIEEWFVDSLRRNLEEGEELLHAMPEQRTFVHGPLAGTSDGILIQGHRSYAFDVKSVSEQVIYPKAHHKKQVAISATLASLVYPTVTNGVLFYVNASNYADIQQFIVNLLTEDELFDELERAHDILRDVRHAWDVAAGPTHAILYEGAARGEDHCLSCPHHGFCSQFDAWKEVVASADTFRGLDGKPTSPEELERGAAALREYARANASEKAMAKLKSQHREETLRYMRSVGDKSVVNPEDNEYPGSAKRSTRKKTSLVLDPDRLMQLGLTVEDVTRETTTESDYLTISGLRPDE